jgi:hypothetical protein
LLALGEKGLISLLWGESFRSGAYMGGWVWEDGELLKGVGKDEIGVGSVCYNPVKVFVNLISHNKVK